jgi:hypothetical protein
MEGHIVPNALVSVRQNGISMKKDIGRKMKMPVEHVSKKYSEEQLVGQDIEIMNVLAKKWMNREQGVGLEDLIMEHQERVAQVVADM